MKMKLFFRMLLCSVALFSFAACSSDDNDDVILIDDGTYSYYGNMAVAVEDGDNFVDENVKIDLVFDSANKKAKLVINQVKFAEEMPIRLDMTAEGFTYTQTNDFLFIVGDNIVPKAMGGDFPQYTITGFKGELDLHKNEFAMSMTCGSYPVSYLGKGRLSN